MGQKGSDFAAMPLCAEHHRMGTNSVDRLGKRRFALFHGIDVERLVARLNARWQWSENK